MDKPVLIGLHGVKRSGKNTTADFIADWAGAQVPALSALERGFAYKAKWAFARQFFPTITMEEAIKWVDNFKDTDLCIRAPFGPGGRDRGDWSDQYIGVIFRQALAQFATEGARDIYGDDFWVDQLLPLGDDNLWPGWKSWWHNFSFKYDENSRAIHDFALITDLRFENEVDRIHQLNGVCWKIRRKDAEDAVVEEARRQGREVHRSELGLPDALFDAVIVNDDNDLGTARKRTEIGLTHLTTSINPLSRMGEVT